MYNNFLIDMAVAKVNNPDWRLGQAAFNAFHRAYPALADKIRGTAADPFYADKMDDPRLQRFMAYVHKTIG
jgi:hypothetical protein